jgi:hypothetical protein
MSLALFMVSFEAATSHVRPDLWPNESGFLRLFLFGENKEDAAHRAGAIVQQLPFVLTTESAAVVAVDGPRLSVVKENEEDPEKARGEEIFRKMESSARVTGIAFAFISANRAQTNVSESWMIRGVFHKPMGPA